MYHYLVLEIRSIFHSSFEFSNYGISTKLINPSYRYIMCFILIRKENEYKDKYYIYYIKLYWMRNSIEIVRQVYIAWSKGQCCLPSPLRVINDSGNGAIISMLHCALLQLEEQSGLSSHLWPRSIHDTDSTDYLNLSVLQYYQHTVNYKTRHS